MQTLPIIAATPSTPPAQAATVMDNNAAPPAEPFSRVLARQRAGADANNPPASQSSASSPADAAAANGDAIPAPVADAASTLPGDLLAALLPAKTGVASDEKKDDAQSASPQDAAALPGAEAAIAPPLPVAVQTAIPAIPQQAGEESSGAGAQRTATEPQASGLEGLLSSASGKPAAPSPALGEQMTSTLSRVPADARAAAAATSTSTPAVDAFAAALETLGKNAASAASADAAQLSAQPAVTDTIVPNGLPQTGAALATNPAAPAQIAVNTPVTQKAWGEEFNQKITWLATQNNQTAELHLNPPQLGPLDVVLNVSGDQATALFTSPHAAVRDAVEQALPKLRDMLADNGITLGNAMVSDQSPKDQQAWQADQRRGERLGGDAGGETIPSAGSQTGSVTLARRHEGMVDTFA